MKWSDLEWIEEATEEESKEILEAVDSLSEDDKEIVLSKRFTV